MGYIRNEERMEGKIIVRLVKVFGLMMAFLLLSGFIFTKRYDTLSELPDSIKKISIFEIRFDKRIHWADSTHDLKLHRRYRDEGLLLVDERDFEFMQVSAEKIMESFKQGQRFDIVYGQDVVQAAPYQARLSKKAAMKTTSKVSSENITATANLSAEIDRGENYYPVLPYHDLRFNKKQRRAFMSDLDTDVMASVHFSYFYLQRFTFGQSFWRAVNPMVWFENLGIWINAKEKQPNSLGLAMNIQVYNKKGDRICNVQYFSLLEQTDTYRLPGYAFHLYPSLRDRIQRSTALLVNNADDFQTLPVRIMSPAYHVRKN